MKLKATLRKQLNKICAKYSGWLYPKEFVPFYDEVAALGVEIPAWDYWSKDNPHPFTLNGEDVENSHFVLEKYESSCGSGKIEFNLYFS